MDLNALVASLLRRWYLLVPGLVLATGVTFLAVTRVGPTYTAEASVLLLPPPTIVAEGGHTVQVNPYMNLGGLNSARDVLVQRMSSRAAQEEMNAKFPGSSYGLGPDVSVNGPLIDLVASSSSKADAMAVLTSLTAAIPQELLGMQADLRIADDVQITSQTLTTDRVARTVRKSQIRAGIVVAAGAVVMTLLFVSLLDGLLAARQAAQVVEDQRPKRTRRRRGALPSDAVAAAPPS